MNVKEIQRVISEKIPVNRVVAEHTEYEHWYRDTKVDELYSSVTARTGILDSPHLKAWAANMATEYIDKNFHKLTKDTKDEIFNAAKQAHKDIFEDAGGIGSEIHDTVERYLLKWMKDEKQPKDIRDFIIGKDVRLWAGARSAELFMNDFEAVPVASELLVASNKYKFAGTLDALCMIPTVVGPEGDTECKHDYWSSARHSTCVQCGRKVKFELILVDWKSSNSIFKDDYAMQVSAYWKAFVEMTGIRIKRAIIVRLDKNQAKYEVVEVENLPQSFKAFMNCSKVYDWLNDGKTKLMPFNKKERIKLWN